MGKGQDLDGILTRYGNTILCMVKYYFYRFWIVQKKKQTRVAGLFWKTCALYKEQNCFFRPISYGIGMIRCIFCKTRIVCNNIAAKHLAWCYWATSGKTSVTQRRSWIFIFCFDLDTCVRKGTCRSDSPLCPLLPPPPPHPPTHPPSSLPVAHPGYQVLSDILFRLGLIANCSHTVQYLDWSDLNWRCNHYHLFWHCMTLLVLMCR